MSVHATNLELLCVRAEAVRAYNVSAPNVPAVNPLVQSLVCDSPVGQPRTIEIFEAFTTAFTEALNKEMLELEEFIEEVTNHK